MKNEETEGSRLFGGQCVPEKMWAGEEETWNLSSLETDTSRWLVSEAVSGADELSHSTVHKPVPKKVERGLRIQV